MKFSLFVNEAVVDEIEDQLAKIFKDYILARKLYEEELKKIYILKHKIEELENMVNILNN